MSITTSHDENKSTPIRVQIILFLSGLIALIVGIGLTFFPVAFQASAGIELGNDISLLNDIRASGGALLGLGTIILLGAFRNRFAFTASLVSAVVYLSYGFARGYAILVDGMPHSTLLLATGIELLMGLLSAWAWRKISR